MRFDGDWVSRCAVAFGGSYSYVPLAAAASGAIVSRVGDLSVSLIVEEGKKIEICGSLCFGPTFA